MVVLWWFCGGFVVVLWWFCGGFVVVLCWDGSSSNYLYTCICGMSAAT